MKLEKVPVRVDLAGGWLDVPRLARPGAFIVNCAVSPGVSLHYWPYRRCAGVGGSAAWHLLKGEDGVQAELDSGVGWQDAAVIKETGLCVWGSGDRPLLVDKDRGDMLKGLMALWWTGKSHKTANLAKRRRNYDLIEQAGSLCAAGVTHKKLAKIVAGVNLSYMAQLEEGMPELLEPRWAVARKYCGSGWGGYALYIFKESSKRDKFVADSAHGIAIEPYYQAGGLV